MTNSPQTPDDGPIPAEQLRMTLLQREMDEMEKRRKAKEEEEKKQTEFLTQFMQDQVTGAEIAMIQRLIMNAVHDGKYETMVYSFPSDLCSDSGRAINNGSPDWPNTLQGKARQLYERYEKEAKPKGYRLKAQIVNYPGGIPGDVGFILNWEP